MSYRNFLTIAAIIAFVFGLGMIFMPTQLFAFYNVDVNAGGALVGQLLGAALLAFGVLNWLGRSVSDAPGRQALVTANLVGDAIGFVIALIGQLNGATGVNALGWSTVAIYFLLAAGFAYFLFMSKEAPLATMAGGSRS